MKVYIGPYRNRWTCQIHYDYMNKKYDYIWEGNTTKYEAFLEKLEDVVQFFYNWTINWVWDKFPPQRMKIHIHNYDTWSMDDTLAHILVPMLKQLRDTKHGAPLVDDTDVPEELKSTSAPAKENDYDIDDNHFKRWDWVLDEMIWAFEQKTYDWDAQYYGEWIEDKTKTFGGYFKDFDDEGRKAHHERMSNGFRLFGKYYEGLWD